MAEIKLIEYNKTYHNELLRALLALHSDYFYKTASLQFQELQKEKDINQSYENYISFLEKTDIDKWKVFIAIKEIENTIVGFIIGNVKVAKDLELGNIGKIEDWYVDEIIRNSGIGTKLYNDLVKWFVEKDCKQITSGTWKENELSIKVHEKLGFFISNIVFSKKI